MTRRASTFHHIGAGWEKFRLLCVPADAGTVQIIETRRAFYAGADYLLKELLRLGALPDAEGEQHLQDMHDECAEFARCIAKGEA